MDPLNRVSVERCTAPSPEIARILRAHLAHARADNHTESMHALDMEDLFGPAILVWTARLAHGGMVGCAALKTLSTTQSELKSMHVLHEARGKGVARALLSHILTCAKAAQCREILLETGSAARYRPARALYHGFGFALCPPFGAYQADPNSVFMRLGLATG